MIGVVAFFEYELPNRRLEIGVGKDGRRRLSLFGFLLRLGFFFLFGRESVGHREQQSE